MEVSGSAGSPSVSGDTQRKGEMEIRRCFEVLDLDPNSDIQEAKQAYRDMVNIWHPDRFSDNPRLKIKAERKLKEINSAYEEIVRFLSHQEKMEETPKGTYRFGSSPHETEGTSLTEAMAEAGTRIFLGLWVHLNQGFRRLVSDQDGKEKKTPGSEAGNG